ncbi:ABC transporter substrate-binding protein [Azospirillum agricola]|uniref:ABC transporter substrate-binding protein n=1 Tax=Azospirillum agricola TaxID=1720247 RepID=UPI000A0F28B5|nr:extracellular solute-binding protein [Azospirillum agricola]SMH39528.1 ABC-type Fe3+ transport system, substrate-binding protein [Azospirillum lipoferum]
MRRAAFTGPARWPYLRGMDRRRLQSSRTLREEPPFHRAERCRGWLRGVAAVAAALLLSAPPALGQEGPAAVTVLTSYPASFYEPVRKAFEQAHPDRRLRVVNTKTTAAITQLQDRAGEEVDVFWASAPDAFEVLKAAGLLATVAPRPTGAPATVGNQPIDDPDGTYLGFALSGYGLVWDQPYLDRHGIAAPRGWEDLRRSGYARHLGITAPSRSGTMHLMVETVLQLHGWERGWATWLEIAGNLATVTARSYGVVEGVARGRFGIGLAIDFLGQGTGQGTEPGEAAAGGGLRFAYPADSVFLPANVAVLRGAPNPDGAGAFIDFLLSPAGQALMLRPDIGRLPVSPAAYAAAPAGYPNPYARETGDDLFLFDRALSSRRYELVNRLFDELITFRVRTLNRVWQLIHEGESRLSTDPDPVARDLLRAARAAATAVPVSAAQAVDPAFSAPLRRPSRGVPVSARQGELEAEWRAFSKTRLDTALSAAERALVILRVAAGEGGWP